MGPFFVPMYLPALPWPQISTSSGRVFDAFARRDIARVEELISEDMEFHAVTAEVAGREARIGARGHGALLR